MLGPIGSEIMAIFRLLSPDEIDKYIVDERADEQASGSSIKVAAGAESMSLTSSESHYEKKKDEKFPKDHQAKIIPLHGRHPEEKDLLSEEKSDGSFHSSSKLNGAQIKPRMSENNFSVDPNNHSLASIGLLSAAQIREIEKQRLREENKKRDSSTVFLLKEREKMRIAKRKLIEQVAIRSYQSNASKEFYAATEDDMDEDENTHDIKGILLNKKHF